MALGVCPECGHYPVASTAPTCPQCGAAIAGAGPHHAIQHASQPTQVQASRGSAGNVVAGLASFFIPGLGQLVQGRVGAGIAHFLLAGAMWLVLLGWVVHMCSAVGAARWKGE